MDLPLDPRIRDVQVTGAVDALMKYGAKGTRTPARPGGFAPPERTSAEAPCSLLETWITGRKLA